MDAKDVREVIEAEGIKTVIVAGTDPAGVLRGKRLTVPYFYSALEHGLNFAMFILKTTPVDDVLPGLFDGGAHRFRFGPVHGPAYRPGKAAPYQPGGR